MQLVCREEDRFQGRVYTVESSAQLDEIVEGDVQNKHRGRPLLDRMRAYILQAGGSERRLRAELVGLATHHRCQYKLERESFTHPKQANDRLLPALI